MYLSKSSSVAQFPAPISMGVVEENEHLSDEDLLELSLKSPLAFEQLIHRYQRQFLSRAQAVTGSRDAAEDVVQDTFVRIYRFAPRFNGATGSFKAWSLTILMNVARTHYRRYRGERDHVAFLEPEHYESLEDTSIKVRGSAEDHIKDVIQDALKKAPNDVSEILTLAFIEDLPYKDIAVRLRLSVPAVKTRVHRAKKVLRAIINNQPSV